MKENYNKTIYACFTAYVVQAIINNFVPLLFLTFQNSYGISLSKITMLVMINFGTQLLVDLLSISFVDKIGYRTSMVLAHICAAAGFVSLTVLPDLFADPFVGLLIPVIIYAVGGGLLEVLVSPVVEACPIEAMEENSINKKNIKERAMSMLHSFYCWGHVGVVLLSTLFFRILGINRWKMAALFWVLIPVINAVVFTRVPMAPLIAENQEGLRLKELMQKKVFWVLLMLMFCAGASEQAVSQWASALAEESLKVSKTIGDLAGTMLFAIMMGTSRMIYGKFGERINLERFMILSAILCIASYLIIALSGIPVLGLIGCGLCGLSVGILWPGTFSTAAASIRNGGTSMFAFLALAGDLGCSGGPTLVGLTAGGLEDNLQAGILAAVVFPLLLIGGILLNRNLRRK